MRIGINTNDATHLRWHALDGRPTVDLSLSFREEVTLNEDIRDGF